VAERTRKGTIHPVSRNERGEVQGVFVEQDGRGVPVRSGTLTMRPVKGETPDGNYIKTKWDEGQKHFKATIHGDIPGEAEGEHEGPTKVNSPAYRDGWDRIWGGGPAGEA